MQSRTGSGNGGGSRPYIGFISNNGAATLVSTQTLCSPGPSAGRKLSGGGLTNSFREDI